MREEGRRSSTSTGRPRAQEMLTTRVVWRPSPIEFNDPFDTRHFWRFGFELDDTVLAAVTDRIARFMQCDGPSLRRWASG